MADYDDLTYEIPLEECSNCGENYCICFTSTSDFTKHVPKKKGRKHHDYLEEEPLISNSLGKSINKEGLSDTQASNSLGLIATNISQNESVVNDTYQTTVSNTILGTISIGQFEVKDSVDDVEIQLCDEPRIEDSQNTDPIQTKTVSEEGKELKKRIINEYLGNLNIKVGNVLSLFYRIDNEEFTNPKLNNVVILITRGFKRACLKGIEDNCELYKKDNLNYFDNNNDNLKQCFRSFTSSLHRLKRSNIEPYLKFDPITNAKKKNPKKKSNGEPSVINSECIQPLKISNKSYSQAYCLNFFASYDFFELFKLYIEFIFSVLECPALATRFGLRPCKDDCNKDCKENWLKLKKFLADGLFILNKREINRLSRINKQG